MSKANNVRFRHPNADGRLFRVAGIIGMNQRLEVGRVPFAGNVIDLGDKMDAEEAREFAESCEEFAREWCEDWRPYWLMHNMARLLGTDPCASVKVTSESEQTCKEIETHLVDYCVPCAARAWMAEFGEPVAPIAPSAAPVDSAGENRQDEKPIEEADDDWTPNAY